jgi:hypothetical protein
MERIAYTRKNKPIPLPTFSSLSSSLLPPSSPLESSPVPHPAGWFQSKFNVLPLYDVKVGAVAVSLHKRVRFRVWGVVGADDEGGYEGPWNIKVRPFGAGRYYFWWVGQDAKDRTHTWYGRGLRTWRRRLNYWNDGYNPVWVVPFLVYFCKTCSSTSRALLPASQGIPICRGSAVTDLIALRNAIQGFQICTQVKPQSINHSTRGRLSCSWDSLFTR